MHHFRLAHGERNLWLTRLYCFFFLWTTQIRRCGDPRRMLQIPLLSPSIFTIMAERAIGGIASSFYTVALTGFIGEQTQPGQTGTVLALYTVTLANLIGIVSAPLAGAAYDALGARWLYAVALMGYALGWYVLRLTRVPQPETLSPLPRTVY